MPQIELIRPLRLSPAGGSELTIVNRGTGTVFYGQEPTVSSTNKTGSIAEAASLTLKSGYVWVVAEKSAAGEKQQSVILDLREKQIAASGGTGESYAAGEGLAEEGSAPVTFKIKALGVTTAMLESEAVTAAELNAKSVTTEKIETGAVTAAKLGTESVETGKIKSEAVTEAKIKALAVTAAKIATATITKEKIAKPFQEEIVTAVHHSEKAGEDNFVIGSPLANLTSGVENTALGAEAFTNLTSGKYNTALGVYSAFELTTGSGNTLIGNKVGASLKSGEYNVGLGYGTLESSEKAIYNVAIGYRTMEESQGDRNIFIGIYAGQHGEWGNNEEFKGCFANIGIGEHCLWKAVKAMENTAVGQGCLEELESGKTNTAIGWNSMEIGKGPNTSYNTGLGGFALYACEEGSYNTACGVESSRSNTSGKNNASVGAFSIATNKTGESNAAFGYAAGALCTGSKNVFLGNEAGGAVGAVSGELYIANNETTPWIRGSESGVKLAFYGATPVSRHATIAVPAETTVANTKAIKELIEAVKGIGIIS